MPAFKRSPITEAIIRYLSMQPKGTSVPYDELSRIVGAEMSARNACLITARRVLEREHLAVWCCIAPGVGVWRLTDPEIAERQRNWFIPGARNKLTAGSRQSKVVELDQLDIDQQARFATDNVIREIGREALSRAMQRRVEKVARGSSNDLPAFNILEWAISLSPRPSRS